MSKISENEREEYYAAFRMFDTDDTGTISTGELGKVMKLLGKNPTDTELNGKSYAVKEYEQKRQNFRN